MSRTKCFATDSKSSDESADVRASGNRWIYDPQCEHVDRWVVFVPGQESVSCLGPHMEVEIMETLKRKHKKNVLLAILSFIAILLAGTIASLLDLGNTGTALVIAPAVILLFHFLFKMTQVENEIFDLENPGWRPFQWVKEDPERFRRFKNKCLGILYLTPVVSAGFVLIGQQFDLPIFAYEFLVVLLIYTCFWASYRLIQLLEVYHEEVSSEKEPDDSGFKQ